MKLLRIVFWFILWLLAGCVVEGQPRDRSNTVARPTVSLGWATNLNYAGGPDIGTPTKIAPSAGRFADGWRNNDVPPAQEQNYWQGLAADWVAWLDAPALSSIPALQALPGGAGRAATTAWGLYTWGVSDPTGGAFGSPYVVTCTTPGGFWVWEYTFAHGFGQVPLIGPAPNDSYPTTTPAGRLNKSIIDHGFHTNGATLNLITDSTTSASLQTFNNAVNSGILHNLGTLAVNDVVQFWPTLTAHGNSGAAFNYEVFVEISEDNGSSWIQMTNQSGTPYRADTSNSNQTIAGGFVRIVANAGVFKIRIRMKSDGTNQLVVNLDSSYSLVIRA